MPHSHNDRAHGSDIDWSANDGNAMGTYLERYVYDAVGNFLADAAPRQRPRARLAGRAATLTTRASLT